MHQTLRNIAEWIALLAPLSLIPLAITLIVLTICVTRQMKKAKAEDWNWSDHRDHLSPIVRAVMYSLAGQFMLMSVVKQFGWVTATLGFALSLALAVLVLTVSVINLPSDSLHERLWANGWKTPIYSRSQEPVPIVRWARRGALAALSLFTVVVYVLG